MSACKGSPQYVDPNLYETQDYSYEWDVYSFGLIILEILTGKFLIETTNLQRKKFQNVMATTLSNLYPTLDKF